MKSKTVLPKAVEKVTDQKIGKNMIASDQTNNKPDKKKMKKHDSALVAASKAGSAVTQADSHAYKDGNFANTGTNLTYRENQ